MEAGFFTQRGNPEKHTVDGQNPAPVEMVVYQYIPFTRFYTYQAVQDFVHQQYEANQTSKCWGSKMLIFQVWGCMAHVKNHASLALHPSSDTSLENRALFVGWLRTA